MKCLLFAVGSLCLLSGHAAEMAVQLENDQVRVLKLSVKAHEEVDWHREDYPRVIVASKGGVITRVEADGSTTEVQLPKGVAVFLEADPPGQLHKSVNNSCKPLELIVMQLKNG